MQILLVFWQKKKEKESCYRLILAYSQAHNYYFMLSKHVLEAVSPTSIIDFSFLFFFTVECCSLLSCNDYETVFINSMNSSSSEFKTISVPHF